MANFEQKILENKVVSAVNEAAEVLKKVADDVNHPSAILLLSAIEIEEGKLAAIGCVVGCAHGLEEALLEAAKENPIMATVIRKVAKKLKKLDKEGDDEFFERMQGILPDEMLQMMRKAKNKLSEKDKSEKDLIKSSERLLAGLKSMPDEKKRKYAQLLKNGMYDMPGADPAETLLEHVMKNTGGEVPESTIELAKYVDEILAEPESPASPIEN